MTDLPEWRNWQTRQTQNLVPARAWRFKSSLRYWTCIPCAPFLSLLGGSHVLPSPENGKVVFRFNPSFCDVIETFRQSVIPPPERLVDESIDYGKVIMEFHYDDGTVVVMGRNYEVSAGARAGAVVIGHGFRVVVRLERLAKLFRRQRFELIVGEQRLAILFGRQRVLVGEQ